MALVYASRAGFAGIIASLAKLGATLIDVPSSVLIGRKFTVGPAWTGSEYQTIQAAIDAADAAGRGSIYGGALIEVYPASYNEAVVIPETMRYWHLVGLGDGGSAGPFTTSLTINVGDQDVDFSCTGFGITTLNVSQPVAGAGTWYGNFIDCWWFGNQTIVGPNLRILMQDCHWYGTGVLNCTSSLRFSVYGCEFLVTGGVHLITSTDTYFANNTLNSGRLAVAGTNCRIWQNTWRDYPVGGAVADQCTALSYAYGNTFSGAASTAYSKTGTSVLRESGNNFFGSTFPFFLIGAGSVISGQLAGYRALAGSPALVASDVAGAVRTTVAKTDGGGTVSLPNPTTVPPASQISVKDLNGNALATPITVDATGGSLIDGAATASIFTNYVALTFQSNGTNWFRVQG